MTFHHVFDNLTAVEPEPSGQEPAQPGPARIATSRRNLDVRAFHVELLPEFGLGGGSFLDVRKRRGNDVYLGLLVHGRSVEPADDVPANVLVRRITAACQR